MIPRGIKPKALRQLLQQVEAAGHAVSITRNNHIRIDTPKGPYFTSYTTSSARTIPNVRSALRKRGVDIP